MEQAEMRFVRGNDVTLLVNVKIPVLDSEGNPVINTDGGITFAPCNLDTFDEWKLSIARQGIKSKPYAAEVRAGEDEGTIVAMIPYTLPCGTYALEFTASRDGQHVRSYELVVFGIVENNGDANVTFDVVEGERSFDIDLSVQYVSQSMTRGKNAYELWREMEGNENKTLQDYFDYLGFQEDYNAKADKVKNATNGNFAALDANGNIKDSGKNESSFLNQEDLLAFPVDNNGYDYVDLGLSSGTLWATKNVGAVDVWDYGNYYRFGKAANKYSYNSPSDDSDYYQGAYSILPLEADTAYMVLGGGWEMPTREQIRELIDETGVEWVESYRNSGVSGMMFSNNGQELFIPAGGWIQSGEQAGVGNYCDIWSKEKSTSSDAFLLTSYIDGYVNINTVHCLTGMNVRGVIRRNEQKVKVPKYITSHQNIEGKENVMRVRDVRLINTSNPIDIVMNASPDVFYRISNYVSGCSITLIPPIYDGKVSTYMFGFEAHPTNDFHFSTGDGKPIRSKLGDGFVDTDGGGYYIIKIIYDGTQYYAKSEKIGTV